MKQKAPVRGRGGKETNSKRPQDTLPGFGKATPNLDQEYESQLKRGRQILARAAAARGETRLEYEKAPGARGGSQGQLDELGRICALIVDATRDTGLWLQSNLSAEEQVHVLAIQAGLADLARIIERRMEHRKEAKPVSDESRWREGVAGVLSRLDKAREVRGNLVGRCLARLPDRLPRELPGSKAVRLVTQAPAEPKASNNVTNERKSFVKPILYQKGWSIHDWATNSKVDFHTAQRYLERKTKPYPSTRKKLADSLGVTVENLPK